MGWDEKGFYSQLCVYDDHIDFSGVLRRLYPFLLVLGVVPGVCCLE